MDVTGDLISLLSVFEAKKAALKRLGDTISDRQVLLLCLMALPGEYTVKTTQFEAFLDLDRSMVERLIGAGYRNMSERGEIGLVS